MREITFDTETTGLSPDAGHRVIEIGCVEMIGRVRTGKVFHTYLNPGRDVPEEVQRIHGITTQFLTDKPMFAEKVEAFLEFVHDAPLVIHNAGFDLKFINHELKLLGFPAINATRAIVDTLELARRKFPGAPASLDALCKRFEVDLSAREKHGALLDAELLADVYLELTGGRQVSLELIKESSSLTAGEMAHPHDIPELPARAFAPTPEEFERHQTMMQKLKNPLWLADA